MNGNDPNDLEHGELDDVFARFMQDLSDSDSEDVYLAASLLCSAARNGHTCIRLSDFAGKRVRRAKDGQDVVSCPETEPWRDRLQATPVVGKPGDFRPLILDERSRLYLYRYWQYERRLIEDIRRRISGQDRPPQQGAGRYNRPETDKTLLKDGLDRLFPPDAGDGVNWRRVAALSAVANNFTVISGSPGTGKTTTVARILGLLLEQAKGMKLRIALAAPTGKASVRLQEAIGRAKETLAVADLVRAAIPENTSTVHRLLGTVPLSPYFRHDAENLLPYDIVVVDEASMIALPLFSKLLQAIRPDANLLILGDRYQLASVEAGAVLGDICGDGSPNVFSTEFAGVIESGANVKVPSDPGLPGSGIHDHIVCLEKNFRYGQASGIGRLSAAVNNGDGSAAWEALTGKVYQDIRWTPLPQANQLHVTLQSFVGDSLRYYLQAVEAGCEPAEIFDRFEAFRILCALRRGPYGSVSINGVIEDQQRKTGLIRSDSRNYPGRPVMITKNDYQTALFNGDIGIMIRDPESPEELRVVFKDIVGGFRKFHPLRLPEHETAYAMTVHKSQGSEYDRVLIVLPDRDSPILTRELIYTAVTRAKLMAELWTDEAVFRTAVSRRIERTSGLKDGLWGTG